MNYFNDPETVKDSKNPLVKDIDGAVRSARSNEKWRHDYMTWQMYGNECKEEGIAQGIKQGIKQGQELGMERAKKETALRMYQKGMTKDLIAEFVGASMEQVYLWINEFQKEI